MKHFITHILAAVALLAVTAPAAAQQVEYQTTPVFQYGEKATFRLYYNLGFVWIHAGNVDFNVKKKTYKGKETMALQVAGYTTSSFDKMYTIRDTFESYISPQTLRPIHYYEAKHEDSYNSRLTYDYTEQKDKTLVHMNRTKRQKVTSQDLTIDKKTLDLIACCYNFRNINTQNLAVGQRIPFNMIFDDDIYNLDLAYKGKETIKLKNGQKCNALKFVPKLITGDLFKDEDDMTIYVSDDENHVPLLVMAKIKVGWVKAYLHDVKNTKRPMTSFVGKKKM